MLSGWVWGVSTATSTVSPFGTMFDIFLPSHEVSSKDAAIVAVVAAAAIVREIVNVISWLLKRLAVQP